MEMQNALRTIEICGPKTNAFPAHPTSRIFNNMQLVQDE